MKIAVEGCAHGELERIYEAIKVREIQENVKVDLLICCGDFQAVRNPSDLQCMAVPDKFKEMGSFYKYYSGEKIAPMLTIFIGGNHEASNYLQELAYGGWVAPNIYYLGYAGVVRYKGVRIGGMSGIFKGHDFNKGHYERPPYNESAKRSAYHVRHLEVFRLKQIATPLDVFISHDWPVGVYHYGNVEQLLRWKPYFRNEIANDTLGSPAAETLLRHLQPSHWFSAHLHVRYEAVIPHTQPGNGIQGRRTNFLALDKCLPKRRFLEILDIAHDPEANLNLQYDREWLAILRATDHLLSVSNRDQFMPGPGYNGRWCFTPTPEELEEIDKFLGSDLSIPYNFTPTAPAFDPHTTASFNILRAPQALSQCNPQTTLFCEKMNIRDPMALLISQSSSVPSEGNRSVFSSHVLGGVSDNVTSSLAAQGNVETNPDIIDLNDEDEDDDETQAKQTTTAVSDSGPDSGSVLFFTDKVGERTPLHLPPPVASGDLSQCAEPRLVSQEKRPLELEEQKLTDRSLTTSGECPETMNSFVSVQSQEEMPHPPATDGSNKKFKRRNIAIYGASDEM